VGDGPAEQDRCFLNVLVLYDRARRTFNRLSGMYGFTLCCTKAIESCDSNLSFQIWKDLKSQPKIGSSMMDKENGQRKYGRDGRFLMSDMDEMNRK